MHLTADCLKVQSSKKLKFHPLAKKLYQAIMAAIDKSSKSYLETVDNFLTTAHDYPFNIIYVIYNDNVYEIVGGCFSPLFNIANVSPNNTLMFRLKTSRSYETKNKSDEYIRKEKAKIEKEFKQDIINLIYLDYLKSISILALKKPGAMDESLRTITKEYKSDIWSEMFNEKCKYLRQVDLAKLLDVDIDTIRNHSK